MELVGFVDLGSNAIRLKIIRLFNPPAYSYSTECFLRIPIRLGDDSFTAGLIQPPKINQLNEAFKAIKHLYAALNVVNNISVATSALRGASNSAEVLTSIFDNSGLRLKIISAKMEARLTLLPILNQPDYDISAGLIHLDIGGGSTECNYVDQKQNITTSSFQLGTVRLKEKKVAKQVMQEFKTYLADKAQDCDNVYGTGGALLLISTLLNNSQLNLIDLLKLKAEIDNLTAEQIELKFNLSTNRSDLVVATIEILQAVFMGNHIKSIKVLETGLIEGLVLDYIKNKHKPA